MNRRKSASTRTPRPRTTARRVVRLRPSPAAVAAALVLTGACSATPAQRSNTADSPPSVTSSAQGQATRSPTAASVTTPVRITIGDTILQGHLSNNAAARSLIRQLPVTLTFKDLNGEEKAGRLPEALSMDGMPNGDDPQPGDIGYYAPWGNLVLYYGDVGRWDGTARIGRLDTDLDAVRNHDSDFTAKVELAQ